MYICAALAHRRHHPGSWVAGVIRLFQHHLTDSRAAEGMRGLKKSSAVGVRLCMLQGLH
jgi:hypothetical protein